MLEGKKGSISIFIQPTKVAGDVAVCMGFNASLNGCCLNKLHCGWSCDCHPSDSEETCVAYAVYLNVNNALCGDPVAMKASKVGETKCGLHNGHFFITWKTKGNLSAVRKSLGVALKALVPAKLKAVYKRLVQSCGGKFSDGEFNYASDKIIAGIKAGVHCGVVGSIKATQEKVNAMLEVLAKKLNHGSANTPKTKPADHKECEHADATKIKVSGWATYVVKDYIQSKAKGVVPMVCNKSLLIPMKPSVWATLSAKLKAQASDHVKARYAKTGDDLGIIMAYLAISNGVVSCADVKSIIKNKPSSNSIVAEIKKVL